MSASNKIGIKVNVEFPTITELRTNLKAKVDSAIDGAEFHKIKLDVNETSLKSARKKINDLLTKDAYEIKINTHDATESINKLNTRIKQIDQELKGTRKLKVDLDIVNLNSSLKELLGSMTKMQNESKNALSQGMSGFAKDLETVDNRLNSISKKYKLNREGNLESITTKDTKKDKLGSTETTTFRENAQGTTAEVEYLHSKEKALEAIKKQLKDVHAIEQSMSKAKHDNDNDTLKRLEQQEKALKKELNSMYSGYKDRYGDYALYEDDIKKLKEKQALENDILRIKQSQENAIKAERAEQERLTQIQKEQQDFEREIATAVSKIAQLEQKRFDIKKKLQSATGEEKQALQEQLTYYRQVIQKIQQQTDVQGYMNREQREALRTQREVNELVLKTIEAKARDVEKTKEQKAITKQLEQELKDVLKIEEKIALVKEQKHKDGSETQLRILQQSLQYAEATHKESLRIYEAEGKITDEMKERLSNMSKISAEQTRQMQNEAVMVREQEQINAKYKEWQQVMSKITQLQRDLIFAGSREEAIISNALRVQQEKARVMREEIMNSRLITAERKREVEQLEQAQREQKQLNALRQNAKETDREFNTVGGVADFRSVYSNYSQGFREILTEVSKVDEAFMKIKKVAEASDESLQEFKKTSYDVASSFGVTSVDYMTSVEKWITAGKTLKQSEELAKITTVGSFVGNIDPGLMSKWLSVPLNAYEDSLIDANDIINVMNETSNNHAVEMEELGKAYMRSASSVTTAGVSFSELTGFITAAQEATRIGGERIGTSLKAISSNYGSIKSQLTGQQQTKHDWFENTLGISIDKTETMTDLFEQLADKWDDMNGVQKNTATFFLAGKEHQNIITAIMNEWDTYQSALADSNFELGNGENGSAYKEFEQQKDSVRFQLAEVQNAWSELMNTIGDSNGLVKNVLSIVTSGLQKLNDIAENDRLMDILQLILVGVGFHAGSNGILRALDLMGTGLRNVKKNANETWTALKNVLSGAPPVDVYGNPVGGRINTNQNNQNGNNQTGNQNNNNNNNNRTPTVVATGRGSSTGRTLRRNNTNTNRGAGTSLDTNTPTPNETSSATGKLSNLGKLAKGVLGFVPLLGDALLVLELMGVDVFGNIGKFFDGMRESSDEYLDSVMKTREELKSDNKFANGDIDKYRYQVTNGTNGFTDLMKNAKENNDYSQLTGDEFNKMKADFNSMVDELGFKEDIKITWNDYDDIMVKLKAYQDELKKLEQKEAKDYAKKTVNTFDDAEKGMDLAQSEYVKYDQQAKGIENAIKKLEELKEKASEKGDDWLVKSYTKDIEDYNKKLEDVNDKAKDAKDKYIDLALSFTEVGEALVKLRAEDINEILSNVNDKEQVTKALAGIEVGYQNASQKLADYMTLQESANRETDVTKEVFKGMIDVLEEQGLAYTDVSYGEYINNVDGVKDAIDGVIDNLVNQQEADVETARVAREEAQKIAEEMGITGEAISAVGTKREDLKKEFEKKIPDQEITFTAKFSKKFEELWSAVKSGYKQVIHFGHEEGNGAGALSKSVSSAVKTQGLVSASVSSNGGIVSNATSSSNKDYVKKDYSNDYNATNANAKVSQDIWRYWKTEDKLDSLSNAMADLERAIALAGEDYSKIGQLLQKELNNLQSQKGTLTTYKGAKTHEAQQILTQLATYGFKVNQNDLSISNLETQSMSLKGDKASSAEELLNTWHSLVSELGTIDQQLKDIATSTQDINDAIKDNKISKEMAVYKDFLTSVEKLQKTINNRQSLNNSFMGLIEKGDYELMLKMTEKMSNDSSTAIDQLAYKFTKLSLSTIQNEENATEFLTVLENLKTQILENADSVIEYTQSLNDMEIERVTSDLENMTNAVGDLQNKLTGTRDSVKEGLLSGTTLGDLQSTKLNQLDLSRKNQLSQMAQDRINLEQKLQEALDGFAVKNVERTEKVSNETLRINTEMYKQLITMSSQYNEGKGISNYTNILSDLSKITGEKAVDENYQFNTELEKLYEDMYKLQSQLNEKYADKLSSENYDARLEAEYDYTVESLKLQKMMLEQSIKTSRLAIEEYNKQLLDDNLTETQIKTIKDAIKSEENAIIEAQGSIKDSIAELYEFQFSKIDELVSKYDELNSALEYSQSIIQAVKPNDLEASYKISEAINDNLKDRKQALNSIIASTEYEMSLQEQGSYEWRILNGQLSEYKNMLQDANLSLVEMNKQMTTLRLDSVMKKFEKNLFGGKTMEQFKDFKDLWLTGLEREFALEDIYDKIAEIGTNAFEEKMALLDKQDKVSRLELDYLAKQLEILELQGELEEGREQRTVKTLQQNADGTFEWNYVVDETDKKEIEDSLKQAQLELLEMEDSAKESYLGKLENIVAGIQEGDYKNKEELKDSLDDLSTAYSLILGDIPASLSKFSAEILKAYEQYELGNSDILDELTNSGKASPTISTIDKFKDTVVSEIQKLGDKLKTAIEGSLNSSVGRASIFNSRNVSTAGQSNPTSVVISKVDFPNVTSSDEIKDAILNLPQYALQHARKK